MHYETYYIIYSLINILNQNLKYEEQCDKNSQFQVELTELVMKIAILLLLLHSYACKKQKHFELRLYQILILKSY